MWALDLGTTNTLLARWDPDSDRPQIVDLPAVSRAAASETGPEPCRAVPSSIHVLENPSWLARFGRSRFWSRHLLVGRLAHIGRPALELNSLRPRCNFVSSFKGPLARSPLAGLARAGGRSYSARELAWLYLRELFKEAGAVSGERIRDLVVTSPVEAFETYRAEVGSVCERLGVRRVRFMDEPVAAAVGYGLSLSQVRRILVVDFGGGTLHIALIDVGPSQAQQGRGTVLAKAGRPIGGNTIDGWLLDEFCHRLAYDLEPDSPLEEDRLWHRLLLAEACRVKEAIYFDEQATFELLPPESLARFEARLHGTSRSLSVDRAELIRILERRGLFDELSRCLDEVLSQARARGASESQIDDVLMVGGSTLLPNVYPFFEGRFGRTRVRAWQPFEAVVYGASAFSANRVTPADFLVHDYALLTYDLKSKEPQYSVVVTRGTAIPTRPDHWKRQLVPTCALGEPEGVFKLVICEIGSSDGTSLQWDQEGRLQRPGTVQKEALIVKLNESNPALGELRPPHSPKDRSPRLEISLGVNADRWLSATVYDLRSRKLLMNGEAVVRLL